MARNKDRPASPEDALLAVVAEYKAAPERALQARDEGIRQAAEAGLKQVDIVRITGYTRETVRQALNPEIRAAVRKAAEERRAAVAAAKQADDPDAAGLISRARNNNRAALDRLED